MRIMVDRKVESEAQKKESIKRVVTQCIVSLFLIVYFKTFSPLAISNCLTK